MTKKILIILAVFALGSLIIGCNAQSSKFPMQIGQAQLTKQESQMIRLIQGDNNAVFDYTINSDVKSVSVVCYKLDENAKWVVNMGPSSFPVKDVAGRIALSFENLGDGFRVAIQEGDDFVASESQSNEKLDTKYMGSGTSYAAAESIEYEKEIPLVMQVFTTKNEMISCDTEFFNKPEEYQKKGYDDVYVVVIKFSKNELI
jgi:hypothetical protein